MSNLIGISGKSQSGKDTVAKIIQYLVYKNKKDGIIRHGGFEPYSKISLPVRNENSGWQIVKFADTIKEIICILTGCTREQLEDQDFKNSYLPKEWNYNIPIMCYGNIEKQMTVRELMQKLGTEIGRNLLHKNVWVNTLFNNFTPEVYWMCDRCMDEGIEELIEIPSRFKDLGYFEDEYVCPNCKGEESEGDLTQVISDNPSKWIVADVRFENELEAIKKRGGINIRVNKTELKTGNHTSETELDNCSFDYTINNNDSIEDLIEKVREILIKEKIIQ